MERRRRLRDLSLTKRTGSRNSFLNYEGLRNVVPRAILLVEFRHCIKPVLDAPNLVPPHDKWPWLCPQVYASWDLLYHLALALTYPALALPRPCHRSLCRARPHSLAPRQSDLRCEATSRRALARCPSNTLPPFAPASTNILAVLSYSLTHCRW